MVHSSTQILKPEIWEANMLPLSLSVSHIQFTKSQISLLNISQASSTTFPSAATVLNRGQPRCTQEFLKSMLTGLSYLSSTQQHDWSSKNVNRITTCLCLKCFIDVILKNVIKEDLAEDFISEVRPTRFTEASYSKNQRKIRMMSLIEWKGNP